MALTKRLFDAHFHIIDPRFPLIENQGFMPEAYTVGDYQAQTKELNIVGGAVVSGSFQGFDQSYLVDALTKLGEGYVGVTQLPSTVSDEEILRLHQAGVRALRFNLKRGGSAELIDLEAMAHRVFELAGWHVELYIDGSKLVELSPSLKSLPKLCIDHLGLTVDGEQTLIELVEQGAYVKACGFGRVAFDMRKRLSRLIAVNPNSLVFATDLPGTRALQPFQLSDITLIQVTIDPSLHDNVFIENAIELYGC